MFYTESYSKDDLIGLCGFSLEKGFRGKGFKRKEKIRIQNSEDPNLVFKSAQYHDKLWMDRM
jgi:hypothetical protein